MRPGDTVLFRGGVAYRGNIAISSAGTAAAPIRFRGDVWGSAKARFEGADLWNASWTRCPSAESCSGNPNFNQIYYATAPAGFSTFSKGIFEDGEFLWFSQGPKPSDPFHYDNIYEYYKIPRGSSNIRQTRTSISDSTRLTQTDSAFWDGAWVISWVQGNVTRMKPVISFNPSTDTITHEDLGLEPYTDRDSYYSLLNHPSLITRPGEYAFVPTENRIYLWPRNSDHPDLHEYSVPSRDTAFAISASFVSVEGFDIQHFAQGIQASSSSLVGITVARNDIRNLRSSERYAVNINASDSVIERNSIVGCLRAVGILVGGARNMVVRSNLVNRTSRQGIWYMGASHSQIVNNTVSDIRGLHANGISLYSGCSDILVAHNSVSQANLPITYEDGSNFTFYGNLVDAGNSSVVSFDWFGTSGQVSFVNNTFVNVTGGQANHVLGSGGARYSFWNNVTYGGGPSGSTHDFNLFLVAPAGWSLAPNELLRTSAPEIFVSPGSNWRPKPGSPAIDSGVDPTPYLPVSLFPSFDFYVDLEGKSRPADNGWDRGAFESGGSVDSSPPVISAVVATNVTTTSATVLWTTDEPSDSRVEYGTSGTFGLAVSSSASVTQHSLSLSNLQSATTYSFRVSSRDATGNSATKDGFSFSTSAPDNTPPAVNIIEPVTGAVLSGIVSISASASDSVSGIADLQFFVGESRVRTLPASSDYAFLWDSSTLANGSYTLYAIATDRAGNQATSPQINVIVQNAQPDLRAGLVAHWQMEESNGTELVDSSGFAHTGTMFNNVNRVSARWRQGLSFDGVDDYARVASTPTLSVSFPMSVAVWVKPQKHGGWQSVVTKLLAEGSHSSPFSAFDITLLDNQNEFKPWLALTGNDNVRVYATATDPLPYDSWCHLVGTYDGTNALLYVNGSLAGSAAFNAPLRQGSAPLYLGANGALNDEFKGLMDDVRIYSRSLSPSEIAQLASANSPLPPQGVTVE